LTDIDLNVYFHLKGPENARICGNPYKIVVNQCRLINVRKNFLVQVSLLLSLTNRTAGCIVCNIQGRG